MTATWTDLLGNAQKAELQLQAGKPTLLEELPLGTKVTLEESKAQLPSSAKWLGANWSTKHTDAVIEGEGNKITLTVTGDSGVTAAILLDNKFDKVEGLALTGGPMLTGGIIAVLGLIAGGGFLLLTARRRRA